MLKEGSLSLSYVSLQPIAGQSGGIREMLLKLEYPNHN